MPIDIVISCRDCFPNFLHLYSDWMQPRDQQSHRGRLLEQSKHNRPPSLAISAITAVAASGPNLIAVKAAAGRMWSARSVAWRQTAMRLYLSTTKFNPR